MFPVSLRAAAFAAAILPGLAAAAPLTLDEAVQRAVQRSEATRAARAGAASASEAARAAGQLPDPMLGVSVENLPATGPERFSTTREGMTMKRIALSQEWVPGDKRALREAAANAGVARENARVASAFAETRLQAALAHVDAYYAGAALELAGEAQHHAFEALKIAKARLASAGTNAPEVLSLSAAQGLAMDEAAEARQQFSAATLALARWTGTADEDFAPPVFENLPDEDTFVQRDPAVVAKRREIRMAQGEAAVAASNRRPNWTWEVAYGQRTGMPDLVSFGVSIPLTVAPAARQDRETAARLALARKAEGELAEAIRAGQAEYRLLASDAARLAERIDSLESNALAAARQRTVATTAALAANQSTLALTFEARHMETDIERKVLALKRDLARVQAQLAFKPVREEDLQ